MVRALLSDGRLATYVFLFTAYCFYVFYRKLFSLLLPDISRDVSLTEHSIGWVISVQCGWYAVGKLVFGVASDAFESRSLLVFGLAAIAVAIQLMALSTNALHFAVVAAVNGFFQGSGWPPITNVLKTICSAAEFGITFTVVSCSNNFAGFIGPFVILLPWRRLSVLTGAVGLVFCVLLWLVLGRSKKKPAMFETDVNGKPKMNAALWTSSCRKLARSNTVWIAAFFYSVTMSARIVAESWMPLFITETISRSTALQATFVFELSGLFGTLAAGAACEVLAAFYGIDRARFHVSAVSIVGMLCSMGFVFSSNWALTFASLTGFFNYSSMTVWCLVIADMTDVHFTGTCSAFINFLGNTCSMVAGIPLSFLISPFGYSVISSLSVAFLAISISVLAAARNASFHVKIS